MISLVHYLIMTLLRLYFDTMMSPVAVRYKKGIILVFSCINICRIRRKLFEHEATRAEGFGNVNALKQPHIIIILVQVFCMIP